MAALFKYTFFIISIFELLSQLSFLPFSGFHNFTKPMLMPALALYFLATVQSKTNFKFNQTNVLIIFALFFAWLGDILLMLVRINANYFLLGLASFLVMQILYIFLFKPFKINNLWIKKEWTIAILIFGLGVFTVLYNSLGPLKLPVLFYFVAILSMALSALNYYGNSGEAGFQVLMGAILFIISDSIIALNKFSFEIPLAGFFIMFTYILAQWLIINGYLKSNVQTKS